MVSMKMSQEEQAEYNCGSVMSGQPEYAYGLRITLDDESLEKLAIPLPVAGSYVMVTARCQVMSVVQTADQDDDGGPDCSVQLQITDMDVVPDNSGKSAADKIYGG